MVTGVDVRWVVLAGGDVLRDMHAWLLEICRELARSARMLDVIGWQMGIVRHVIRLRGCFVIGCVRACRHGGVVVGQMRCCVIHEKGAVGSWWVVGNGQMQCRQIKHAEDVKYGTRKKAKRMGDREKWARRRSEMKRENNGNALYCRPGESLRAHRVLPAL